MKQKNILFGLITLVLLSLVITSVSAQDYLPHKIDTDLNLIVSSNNASQCNITSIQYSDGSASLVTFKMDKTSTSFNYTIDDGNFSSLGDICFDITCTDNSTNEVGSICRTVTPNGVVQSTAQGIGSISFLILILVLTFIFGWMGFKLVESDKLWVLGVFFLFLSILFIVYDVWLGYEYHRNYTGSANSGVPEIIFYIFMFLLVAGFVISGLLLFTKWEKIVKYFKREVRKAKAKREEDEMDRGFEL
ncbi:MAG TPA: hypothetical protein VMZ91_14705 [Candidatus Paceibacterota bacterium]|nr:hypothetical protein [Candidatus Paceibacterota bacterium]